MHGADSLTNVTRMDIPIELGYTKDHEWARIEGKNLRIGVTDYAQDALGDVVFVQLPALGSAVSSGASFAEVESTKSVSDIYAPISGKVIEVNERLSDSPELINYDPYGEGWLCVIEAEDEGQFKELLSADSYRELIS